MPCKIAPSFDDCPSMIASFINKAAEALSELEAIDTIYPLVQAAIRNGDTGKVTYPRLQIEKDCDTGYIDLFPGQRLEESYAFFEKLSDIQLIPDGDYARYTLGIVFWIRNEYDGAGNLQKGLLTKIEAQAYSLVKHLTEVISVRIEDRIKKVWGEYSYDIEDFGQFQHPHYTFKLIIEAHSHYVCC